MNRTLFVKTKMCTVLDDKYPYERMMENIIHCVSILQYTLLEPFRHDRREKIAISSFGQDDKMSSLANIPKEYFSTQHTI